MHFSSLIFVNDDDSLLIVFCLRLLLWDNWLKKCKTENKKNKNWFRFFSAGMARSYRKILEN